MKSYKVQLTEGTAFIFNAAFYYYFLKKIITPFDKTKAFKLGIIDDKGKNLIPRSEFTTTEQKNAYTKFDVLIFNLKKLLAKVPGGKTKLATFAAALWLLKEEKNAHKLETTYEEQFGKFMEDILNCENVVEFFEDLDKELNQEDVAANSVAGGGVAMYSPVLNLVTRKKKKFQDFV